MKLPSASNEQLIVEYLVTNLDRMHLFRAAPVLAGLVLTSATGGSANADVIATCRDPKGQSFYMKSAAAPDFDPAWEEDAISGKVVTLRHNGETYELEVSGEDISGDGGQQYLAWSDPGSVSIVVVYPPQLIESYTFDLLNRTLLWSQARQSSLIRKGSLLVAGCN